MQQTFVRIVLVLRRFVLTTVAAGSLERFHSLGMRLDVQRILDRIQEPSVAKVTLHLLLRCPGDSGMANSCSRLLPDGSR